MSASNTSAHVDVSGFTALPDIHGDEGVTTLAALQTCVRGHLGPDASLDVDSLDGMPFVTSVAARWRKGS
jgi:hypothetical protein